MNIVQGYKIILCKTFPVYGEYGVPRYIIFYIVVQPYYNSIMVSDNTFFCSFLLD